MTENDRVTHTITWRRRNQKRLNHEKHEELHEGHENFIIINFLRACTPE